MLNTHHRRRRDEIVLSRRRRRCEHNSQLAHDVDDWPTDPIAVADPAMGGQGGCPPPLTKT